MRNNRSIELDTILNYVLILIQIFEFVWALELKISLCGQLKYSGISAILRSDLPPFAKKPLPLFHAIF